LYGKYLARNVVVEGAHVDFLLNEGKILRDSLTHPSPYSNYETNDPGKIVRILQMNSDTVGRLFAASIEYVLSIASVDTQNRPVVDT